MDYVCKYALKMYSMNFLITHICEYEFSFGMSW